MKIGSMWRLGAGPCACVMALAACSGGGGTGSGPSGGVAGPTPAPTVSPTPTPTPTPMPKETATTSDGVTVDIAPIAAFEYPWAINFIPDGRLLVTQAFDGIRLVAQNGSYSAPLAGLPKGFRAFDIILSADYATSHKVVISFDEPGTNGAEGLAVATAELVLPTDGEPRFENFKTIWSQTKTTTAGQFGGKLAFSPDGKYLFITTGERATFDPAQDLSNTLGKTIRLFADGTIPPDNPFVKTPGAMPEIWTLGHRNPYGIAFDAAGRQWQHEMGPKGGDELNLIVPGGNYGWPKVSWGNNYDGGLIPKPATGDGYVAPVTYWDPVIAPAGMIIYSGKMFRQWAGYAIMGGLQSQGLVFVKFNGTSAAEVARLPLHARIRDVREGSDGAIWVLEDTGTGRVLRVSPRPN